MNSVAKVVVVSNLIIGPCAVGGGCPFVVSFKDVKECVIPEGVQDG